MTGGAGSAQYFSLRWNNHPVNMVSVFTGLYQAESLVDVSLAAEGKELRAHKVVLSACSDYFALLFAANPCQHPIVILKDVAFDDLQMVVKFMYHGFVNVSSDKLPAVLKTADALQIKGLEKNNELMNSYLSTSPSRQASLLSVPGQTRQPSTESLPEYLQRSSSHGGYFPHRAHSAESRGMSFESPLEVPGRPKRLHSPPPGGSLQAECGSPAAGGSGATSYARKKFRNRSENLSSQGTSQERSVEQQSSDLESGSRTTDSPPPSSQVVVERADTEHIAKKKRAMFQARKSGSSSGSKSSEIHNSSDGRTDKKTALESQSSSSLSISHSSDREEVGGQVKDENTLQVPSIAQSRTMVRAASASEVQHHSALTTKFKRGRFLQRQQCQEATEEAESTGPVTRSEPPPSPPSTQQLVKQHSSPLLPSQAHSSPHNSPPPVPPPKEEPLDPLGSPPNSTSQNHPPTPARQPSLDPLCGLDSIPLLYSSSGPRLPPFRPTLPSVRITPESHCSPPHHELVPHPHHSPTPAISPTPSQSLLYPGVAAYEQVSPQTNLHHSAHLLPHPGPEKKGGPVHHKQAPQPALQQSHLSIMTNNNPAPPPGQQYHQLSPSQAHQQGHHGPASLSPVNRHLAQYNSHNTMEQFGHCPKAREGPALSCNFCWNTTDGSGRILRRKTKYHCPECQTNLCIVPCFQQYHEAMENENAVIH